MATVKIGVIGVGRGTTMINFCEHYEGAEIVAICDKWIEGLKRNEEKLKEHNISYYTDYDEFLKHDMDIVMLANYANEHAPFAIKAMEAGKNVISEVLPCQTMAEAVELIECVERTGKKYIYAENYSFMGAPRQMKKLFESGELGTFEYGEGEYMHNCEPIWTDITYGEREHWRNRMSAFFYCTHSFGPLLHITGMRPVKVTGFEGVYNARMARMGALGGNNAVEMVTLENGALVKSLHGVGCSKNSIWYSIYGSKGRIESCREDAQAEETKFMVAHKTYTNLDEEEGKTLYDNVKTLNPEDDAEAIKSGHGGSDYYCLSNAVRCVAGDTTADIVDVYEAVNSWMAGFFGYISVLEGGIPQDIPDLRLKSERDKYRNDKRCCDPKVAGDQLLPSFSKGNAEIPDEVYTARRKEWEDKHQPQIEFGKDKNT